MDGTDEPRISEINSRYMYIEGLRGGTIRLPRQRKELEVLLDLLRRHLAGYAAGRKKGQVAQSKPKRRRLNPEELALATARYKEHLRAVEKWGGEKASIEQFLYDFQEPEKLVSESWTAETIRQDLGSRSYQQYSMGTEG